MLTNAKLLIFLNLNKTQILTQKTNNTSHTKDLHQHTLSENLKNKKKKRKHIYKEVNFDKIPSLKK